MKYLVMIYSNPTSRAVWDRFSDSEKAAGLKVYSALIEELAGTGELVVTEALADPSHARRPAVTEALAHPTDRQRPAVTEALAHPTDRQRPAVTEALAHPTDPQRPAVTEALAHPTDPQRPAVTEALAHPSHARRPGAVLPAGDGPYAEAKEHLAGFFLVDCASMDRALEIAARIPEASHGLVEVRPTMTYEGMDV